jgi:hypothetical protein
MEQHTFRQYKSELTGGSFGKVDRTFLTSLNGTAHFKQINSYLNTNIYSYLETSGGQSSNLYVNFVHFFKPSVN